MHTYAYEVRVHFITILQLDDTMTGVFSYPYGTGSNTELRAHRRNDDCNGYL